jgi:hypothetical protein
LPWDRIPKKPLEREQVTANTPSAFGAKDIYFFYKEELCRNIFVMYAVMFMILPREIMPGKLNPVPPLRVCLRIGFAPFAAWEKRISPPLIDRMRAGMLSRADFIFTIGYDGPMAVVDGQAKRKYGALSTRELVEKGLFRAAYSSAVFSKKPEEIEIVAESYNKAAGTSYTASSSLDRLFGVFPVEVKRALIL